MTKSAIANTDPELFKLIQDESARQQNVLGMIPSENIASPAVMGAVGSVLMNKYSEGYPGKRYYGGNEVIDHIEQMVIDRVCSLFNAEHANVQPYSGSPANLAVYLALLQPGDVVMGMSLPHGGHLTHGWKASITGKYFRSIQYITNSQGLLDYDAIRELALAQRPRLIIAGATAYPRVIDFGVFAEIAKECDAYLLADIAHIAGLVAGNMHPSPVPFADIVSMTTHKTLRGPRGAILLSRTEDRLSHLRETGKPIALSSRIDRAVFPGLQGGPHNHTIAGIAVALHEAATPEFAAYAKQVVVNARALAETLLQRGITLVTGGTDNHLILCDLQSLSLSGAEAERVLGSAGIVVNKNMVPNDPRSPLDPSGIRLGTPLLTSRGMGIAEMRVVGSAIADLLSDPQDSATLQRVRDLVQQLTAQYPISSPESSS